MGCIDQGGKEHLYHPCLSDLEISQYHQPDGAMPQV